MPTTPTQPGRGEALLLLAHSVGGRRLVASACRGCRAAGVRPGMTVAHATALLPSPPVIRPARPAADADALRALARWALRFTPLAAVDPPDGLVLDLTGCGRLYGSLRHAARTVHQAVTALGLGARVAVARTAGAAWGVARFAPASAGPVVLAVRRTPAEALASLPVAALGIDAKTQTALQEVGIDRVADLLAVPRRDLAHRFDLSLLTRLDAVLGRTRQVLEPEQAPKPPAVSFRFEGPTLRQATIEQATRELVHRLCRLLAARESGVRRLTLNVERLDEAFKPTYHRQDVSFSRPSRDVKHIWAVLRPALEKLHLGQGVERLGLTAAATAVLRHAQLQTDGSVEATDVAARQEGEMIDRLKAALGAENVLRAVTVESHVPEAAFCYYPADEAPAVHPPYAPEDGDDPDPTDPAGTPGVPGVAAGDRPVTLLNPPERAQVTLLNPEGPVIVLHWRGTTRRIVASVGPERIGRRWWHSPPSQRTLDVRDYYRLCGEDGLWLWAFRALPDGNWFIHGLWA